MAWALCLIFALDAGPYGRASIQRSTKLCPYAMDLVVRIDVPARVFVWVFKKELESTAPS